MIVEDLWTESGRLPQLAQDLRSCWGGYSPVSTHFILCNANSFSPLLLPEPYSAWLPYVQRVNGSFDLFKTFQSWADRPVGDLASAPLFYPHCGPVPNMGHRHTRTTRTGSFFHWSLHIQFLLWEMFCFIHMTVSVNTCPALQSLGLLLA